MTLCIHWTSLWQTVLGMPGNRLQFEVQTPFLSAFCVSNTVIQWFILVLSVIPAIDLLVMGLNLSFHACNVGDPVRPLSQEDPLQKEMATHSSILGWKIPWTEEPGGLQSLGSQRVGLDWATNALTFHHIPMHIMGRYVFLSFCSLFYFVWFIFLLEDVSNLKKKN